MNEIDRIRQSYKRRLDTSIMDLYNPLRPSVYMAMQEKDRALIRLINYAGILPLNNKRILEIGCGSGSNLLKFIELGCEPENLVGNELLEDRASLALSRLPAKTEIVIGDAAELALPEETFDIVMQSTVFSSLLDVTFQQKLATRMWSWTKPGGGLLWYDFIYNNPKNPDVIGVPVKRIKSLFPLGTIKVWRLTLAPPINRLVTRIHPNMYNVFNIFPFLRTHVLVWIGK